MNIISTQYTLENRSLDIYISGCKGNPHCTNCHNPESWDFDTGEYYKNFFWSIQDKLKDFNSLIDNIMIFGGEPLDQNLDELEDLLLFLNLNIKKEKIWLFTRFEIVEVPDRIKDLCHYVKTGRYLEEFKTDNNIQFGISLATSNQKIFKI